MPVGHLKPVTGCLRYVCLAEYRCRCRPAGIPVSLSTMLRHRKVANERRSELRLSQLPWGPQHTKQRATEIALRFRSLPSIEQAVVEPYSFSLSVHDSPQKAVEVELLITPEEQGSCSISFSEAPSNESPEDIMQPAVVTQPSDIEGMVDGQIETGDSSDQGESDGDRSVLDAQSNDDIDAGNHWNARTYLSFKNWATENRKWIETCLDFSVTGALFDRILSNIDAPYIHNRQT